MFFHIKTLLFVIFSIVKNFRKNNDCQKCVSEIAYTYIAIGHDFTQVP